MQEQWDAKQYAVEQGLCYSSQRMPDDLRISEHLSPEIFLQQLHGQKAVLFEAACRLE